jgi:hypothetical protein
VPASAPRHEHFARIAVAHGDRPHGATV